MKRALLVAATWWSGCASTPPPPPAPVQPATITRPQASIAFDSSAPPRVEAPTFALELTSSTTASVAEPAPISIVIEGRGDHHVNLEYPLQIELGASDAAVLTTQQLHAADASELNEHRARFEAQVHWRAAGQQWIAARIRFAVCTPDTCIPREEALALPVVVQ